MSIFKKIGRLAQHSAIYAISTAVQKLSGFLLIPIYTNPEYIKTTSDFGDFVVIFTFLGFMYFFYTYGMDSAMLRYFFLGERDRKTVFSSTFVVLLCTSLVTTVILVTFSEPLADLILKSPDYANFVRLGGFILFFDALGNLPYLILRAEEKAIQFTSFRVFRFLLELSLNIYFVVFLKTGVIGILYTSLTASIVNFLVMLPIIVRYLNLKIDIPLCKEMLAFGLPFLPHGIAFTAIEMIDRLIVPVILDKDAVGIYGANYKFGTVLLLLINAFKNAWQPFFLKIAKEDGARQIYSRVLSYFLLGAGFITLLGTFFIRDILTFKYFDSFYFLGEPFWSAIDIIPIILLSYCFYGIYVILTPGFYITKKSKYMIIFTGSGAVLNIVANIILLPHLHIWGAAWATLISYMTMALTIFIVSDRIFPIPIEWGRIAKISVGLIGLMMAHYLLDLSIWLRLLLVALSLIIAVFWILTDEERNAAAKALRAVRP